MRLLQTDIREGQLVCLFNGVRQRHCWGSLAPTPGWSDYRIACQSDLDLDILPQQTSLASYSATIGHKAAAHIASLRYTD